MLLLWWHPTLCTALSLRFPLPARSLHSAARTLSASSGFAAALPHRPCGCSSIVSPSWAWTAPPFHASDWDQPTARGTRTYLSSGERPHDNACKSSGALACVKVAPCKSCGKHNEASIILRFNQNHASLCDVATVAGCESECQGRKNDAACLRGIKHVRMTG